MESEKGKQSRYVTEYRQFMGSDGDDRYIEVPPEDTLKKYRAQWIPTTSMTKYRKPFSVRLAYIGQQASTASYIVDIGSYRFTINVLNLPGKVKLGQDSLGEGGFGTVVSKQVADTEFAAKIIELREKKEEEKGDKQGKKKQKQPAIPEELHWTLTQVAISKLCAMHQIGPDVLTAIPYDIILYADAVQFHLERCESVYSLLDRAFSMLSKYHPNKVKDDLVDCIRGLHSLHIAHKDIKPSNVLYCKRLDKFVLCDFGIAEYVNEEIGYVSEAGCAGTRRFMGPEMQQLMLSKQRTGKVDLYYNDVYACGVLLSMIAETDRRSKLMKYREISQERCSDVRRPTTKIIVVSSNSSDTSKQTGDTFTSKNSTLEPIIEVEVEEEKPESLFEQLDCYEFYTVVYAATALNEHDFNLRGNLPRLTPQQKYYVYEILVKCLNRAKMDRVIKELQQMQPKEGTLESKWLEDFRRAYRENFDEHKPLFAKVQPIGKECIGNLIRLLGRRERLVAIQDQLQIEEQLEGNGDSRQPTEAYETVIDEIRKVRFKRLFSCGDKIREKFEGACEDEVSKACYYVVIGIFGYDAKEFILFDLLSCLQQRMLPTNQPYLQCLTAIINKDRQATVMLRSLIVNSELLERCLMLTSLCYRIFDEPRQLVDICSQLLERLAERPPESCFLETVNMRHIIFEAEYSGIKLSHQEVRLHFRECIQLLYHYSSHQDAYTTLIILQHRLAFFQNFNFPAEEISTAHVEFERHRQFYSGQEDIEADVQVMNSYRYEKLPAPESISKLDSQLLRLQKYEQELYGQGLHRQCLEVHERVESLEMEKHRQSGETGKYEASIGSVLYKVHLLVVSGRSHDAQELLSSVEQMVRSSSVLLHHRDYYYQEAEVSKSLGKYSQAYESCAKAIDFNSRLGGDRDTKHYEYLLLEAQANICFKLGQRDRCIRILDELRTMLLQTNALPSNYQNLASNYTTTADALWGMDRLDESSDFCAKVFELEQQGHIAPHESAFVHQVMAKIAMDRGDPAEQLRQSWLFIEKTRNLGNESFCIAYTAIIRSHFPTVGREVMSFASYTRKFTDPPRQIFRGDQIAEELYLNPVPTGLLPLDMPISEFTRLAQTRLRTLPKEQHQPCYLFKTQLLTVLASQSTRLPPFKLLYVRTLIEAYLHELMTGQTKEVIDKLPPVLSQMKNTQVEHTDQKSKQTLVEFAERTLASKIEEEE